MTVPQMRIGPLLQYFCSLCDKILKDSTTIEIQNQQIKEEEKCPFCGALLVDTLQNRTVSASVPEQAVVTKTTPKSVQDLSVEFRMPFIKLKILVLSSLLT